MAPFRESAALFAVCALVSVGAVGCGDSGDDNGGATAPAPPSSEEVSFAEDIQPIFNNNCAFSGCHSSQNPQRGLNLSAGAAYLNIVNVPSSELPSMDRIEPSDPENSYLVHKIQGSQASVGGSGDRMPLAATALPQATIDLVHRWVSEGARNN